MPETKFTPGPWRVTSDAMHAGNHRITSDSRIHIAKVYALSASPDEHSTANANVIAAAPALYEALAALLERESPQYDSSAHSAIAHPFWITEAAAALALARGEGQ